MLLVTDLLIGGTPTVVRELAVRLKREGVEVQVACLSGWGPVAEQIRQAGVKVTALGARGAWDVGVFGRVTGLVRRERVDVVMSFLVHANAAAAWVKVWMPGVRVVESIQTTQERPRWHWWVQRLAAKAADRVVAPSVSVGQVAQGRCGIEAGKIQVIANAVNVGAFAGVAPVSMERRPLEVGFIGRLDPVKRIGDVMEAVRILGNDARLHVFGTGELAGALEREAQSPGLRGRVVFHGEVTGPQVALGQIAVLVLASEAEGFGLVLIEAMAAGVPVVATDVPGIRDVVEHEKNGLLVAVRSPEAIARAIRRLAGDGELRARLVEGGRQSVRKTFGWQGVLRAYRELLGV